MLRLRLGASLLRWLLELLGNCDAESYVLNKVRIRVGGTAELAGFDLDLRAVRRRTLGLVAGDLFRRGGDLSRAEFWRGLRPMGSDDIPVLGRTSVLSLYLGIGHGILGWAMAAGVRRASADSLSGREPEMGMSGLGLERYLSE